MSFFRGIGAIAAALHAQSYVRGCRRVILFADRWAVRAWCTRVQTRALWDVLHVCMRRFRAYTCAVVPFSALYCRMIGRSVDPRTPPTMCMLCASEYTPRMSEGGEGCAGWVAWPGAVGWRKCATA